MKGSAKYANGYVPNQAPQTFAQRGHERWQTDENGSPVRNKRSVWTVPTLSYNGAHFATFPPDLIKPCILAGTSSKGCCAACGAPYERVVERNNPSKEFNTGADERYATLKNMGGNHQTIAGLHRNSNGKTKGVYSSAQTKGWQAACKCCEAADMRDGDLEIINTPTGERVADDPSLLTGRAGMNRPRHPDEGRRPITRYEQRHYAEQLRQSPNRSEMQAEVGSAFEHYIRTDRSGARPLPPDVLAKWLERGWLERVVIPEQTSPPIVPCTVLDPFAGSGTTGKVAIELGRRAVLIELNPEYIKLIEKRCQTTMGLPLAV